MSRSRSHVSDGAKDWPEDVKMQKRWKWVRYERKHSPAEHIDWNEQNEINIKVCVILDDASRMASAGDSTLNKSIYIGAGDGILIGFYR